MKIGSCGSMAALFIKTQWSAPSVKCNRGGALSQAQRRRPAREALDRYNQAVERLKSGDWKGFGTQFDAMREVLERMNRQSTGH